jgi:hypothetical protein
LRRRRSPDAGAGRPAALALALVRVGEAFDFAGRFGLAALVAAPRRVPRPCLELFAMDRESSRPGVGERVAGRPRAPRGPRDVPATGGETRAGP